MSNLQDQLDADYAEAWKPAPGQSIVGVVVDVTEREGAYGRYPIVTLRTEAGDERALHAFHEVLADELAKLAPKPGDEIGVKFLGKHPERKYYRYRARRSGATAEVAWSKYAGGGESDEADALSAAAPRGVHAPLDYEAEAATVAAEENEQNAIDAAAEEVPF